MATLVLSRAYVAACLPPAAYVDAVEAAFRQLAANRLHSLPVGHVDGIGGAFHVKAAVDDAGARFAVLKVNGNFPGNPARHGLPTIQGCVLLLDRGDGRVLAIADSIEITARRTAAASVVAARHLARADASTLALIGSGIQGACHLEALHAQFRLRAVRCHDVDANAAAALRDRAAALGLAATVSASVRDACRGADLIVTCTPAAAPILGPDDVEAGAFVAAVGADNPGKNELAPALLARARVVADVRAQAETMGDLRAALAAGVLRPGDVDELAQVVAGARPGRVRDDEIIVFDSTGTAIEDLAAMALLYARASDDPAVPRIALNAAPA